MKVYISVDMEGIAGVSHPDPTGRGDRDYPAAVELMVGEANAAVAGAFDAGAAEVVVNDSHGGMFNLTPERMHAGARLVQGQKPYSMVEAAATAGFGVALFVGYHARAGHPRGTIAHTYSGAPTLTTLDGRPVGEYGINGVYLGALGVPIGMVTGDDALAEEVADWLPGAERVVVKRAVSGHAADAMHPSKAREQVEAGARRAVERAIAGDPGIAPLVLPPPIRVGIDFGRAAQADYVAVMPGMRREGDRGVVYEAEDGIEAFRAFVCAVRLAGLVGG
jgi:D-amino peptidase